MNPEAIIVKAIRIALAKDGRARVVPNRVGVAIPYGRPDARPVEYGLGKGSADLVGILKGAGRVFCLEVKVPGAKPQRHEANQLQWHDSVRRLGGFVAQVTSPAEALAAVDRALKGASR